MEIHINKDFMRNRLDIYLFDRNSSNGKMLFYIPASPDDDFINSYKYVEIDENEVIPYNNKELKPFLTMPFNMATGFITLIAEYAKNQGISVKEQSNNEGKLQAIQEHNKFLQTNLQKLIDFAITPPCQIIENRES